jgi:hypothetical protein
MNKLDAFVGYSFEELDKVLVDKFLTFFNSIRDMNIGFNWDHAEKAEPKKLSKKVKDKMQNKNCFIGICTAKEYIIDPDKCKPNTKNDNVLKINNEDIVRKTSDWIIQEIAFALGRGMELIILLEEDVRRPGELQGDIEHISFNREMPEKAFTRILQMISSLIPKMAPAQSSGVEKPIEQEPINKEDITKDSQDLEPSGDWDYWDYRWALFNYIIADNKEKQNEIFSKYLETEDGKDEYNKIKWEADRLYFLQYYKKEDSMEKIIKIYKEHPTHSYVNSTLAILYENLEEFGKAATSFKTAAINSMTHSEKFDNLCNAAKSWAQNGNIGEMISSLNEAKDLREMVNDGESKILKMMGQIYNILNDNENCLAFMEGFIDQKPYDHNTRFSLAYKYSQVGEHDISLYHYKILIEQRQEKSDWNNIGWARENLKLPGKAIASYRESEKLGETLAMSNLAYNFIDSGFFDEAKQLCTKAKENTEYNERIDSALAKISELKTEEDKKEKDFIKNTKRIRLFYIEYAHACSKKSFGEFSGKFKGPDCELDIIIKNNTFEARGSFEKSSLEGGWALGYGLGGASAPGLGIASALGLGGQTAAAKKITMVVEYNGELLGQGIKYKLYIHDKESIPTLLGGNADSGLMIITDELSEIKVYQKGTRASEKFYSLLRIE